MLQMQSNKNMHDYLLTKIVLVIFFYKYQTWQLHRRQRAPVKMFCQVPVKSAQLDWHTGDNPQKWAIWAHSIIVSSTRRCRYWSIIILFHIYVSVVNFIDYLYMDKMMDINNDKC
jgi:hypothetical protein